MGTSSRRRLSGALVVLGTLVLVLAVPFMYLDRNVFEPQGFADNAAETLESDAVRKQLSAELTGALVARDPQLVAAAPVLAGVADTLLESAQAASLVRAAAVQTHNALFSTTEGSVVIDLANLGVIALEFLTLQDPALEDQLQAPRDIAIQLADRTLTVQLVDLADRVRTLAIVLPLLALALFAAALALDPWRRRAALNVGIGFLIAAATGYVALIVTRALVLYGDDGDRREVTSAIFEAFLGGFAWWCAAVGLAGAIIAASAASVLGDLDPARVPQRVWAWITRPRRRRWQELVGAVVLILGGTTVIADPLATVRLLVGLVGAWMIFAGVVTFLRMVVRSRADEPEVTPGEFGREFVPWLIGAVAAVALVTVGLAIVIGGRGEPEPAAASDPGCNGAAQLCARRFDAVVFPTSHNAMASAQSLFLNANHGISMRKQLDAGVRGLLLDAYLGQRNAQGVVRTDLADKAVAEVEAKIGEQGLAAAQRLAGSVAFGPVEGEKQLYLCHILCELGAYEASEAFADLRDWLDRNPREVLAIMIEDAAPTQDIKRELERAGLAEMASDFQPGEGRPFPTLEQMIDSGRRLWIMAEENGVPGSWYHEGYEVTQETPFSFTSPAQLQTPESCRPNRGGTKPPLFLVNSWVETYPPNPRNADVVNQIPFLVERARRCERIRDRVPNFLAVDFVERGDVVGAAEVLNGLRPAPEK
jgi:hypothetical protein